MPFPLNLLLIHPDQPACDAFTFRFAALPNVRVIKTTFETIEPHDCFVTAGNAFGIMTFILRTGSTGRPSSRDTRRSHMTARAK
jgi:hypothetical protein